MSGVGGAKNNLILRQGVKWKASRTEVLENKGIRHSNVLETVHTPAHRGLSAFGWGKRERNS